MTRLAIVRGRYHLNRTPGGGRSYQKVNDYQKAETAYKQALDVDGDIEPRV